MLRMCYLEFRNKPGTVSEVVCLTLKIIKKQKVCKHPLGWQTSLFPSNHSQLVSDASQSVQHGVQRLPAQLHRHRRNRISSCRRLVHLEG